MRKPKLIDKFSAALPVPARLLFDQLLRLAERRGAALYLVGGPLRDLLLDRPSLDLDIAVEADAALLARELAEVAGGRTVSHPSFLTASVRAEGFHVDLVTARLETYARPGALPNVRPASIHEDLRRRDFTINALALRLDGPQRGDLLDPAGGLADLDSRLVRILHERSFQDDATRILRAFRYAVRFGFQVEAQTHKLLADGVAYLHTISAARVHREFARIAAEPEKGYMLLRLNDLRALSAIHDSLRFHQRNREIMDTLRSWEAPDSTFWPALIWPDDVAAATSVGSRLALTSSQQAAVAAVPEVLRLVPKLSISNVRRSRRASLLGPFPVATVWAVAAASDGIIQDRLLDYLTTARYERPRLTGNDLLTLGVPHGPAIGDVLRRLRAAKLDREVRSRDDEERLVMKLLADDTPRKTLLPARPETLEG